MIAKPYEYGTCKAESPSFITYPTEESKLFIRLNQIKSNKNMVSEIVQQKIWGGHDSWYTTYLLIQGKLKK